MEVGWGAVGRLKQILEHMQMAVLCHEWVTQAGTTHKGLPLESVWHPMQSY